MIEKITSNILYNNKGATTPMIQITDSAIQKIKSVLKEESAQYLRLYVEGGGCSGFQYGFKVEVEREEDDHLIDDLILIDSMSIQYLNESTVDYKKDLMGESFSIQNPNVTSKCGCGQSFQV